MTDENWYEEQMLLCVYNVEMALERLEGIREQGMMSMELSGIEDRLQTIFYVFLCGMALLERRLDKNCSAKNALQMEV